MAKSRVIAYIDGFNLYYGIRAAGWKQYYWLDPHRLAQALAGSDAEIVTARYFTARVKGPAPKRQRQTAYLDAVRAGGGADIILGKYYEKPRECRACGARWRSHEEKMTDSAIAAHLVADAFLNAFDTALLIGGDTDIVPAVRMVRTHFPGKTMLAWFPPRRKNQAVADICHGDDSINGTHLRESLMPDEVEVAPGIVAVRPAEWS